MYLDIRPQFFTNNTPPTMIIYSTYITWQSPLRHLTITWQSPLVTWQSHTKEETGVLTFWEGVQSEPNDTTFWQETRDLERHGYRARDGGGEGMPRPFSCLHLLLQGGSGEGVAAPPTHVMEVDERRHSQHQLPVFGVYLESKMSIIHVSSIPTLIQHGRHLLLGQHTPK